MVPRILSRVHLPPSASGCQPEELLRVPCPLATASGVIGLERPAVPPEWHWRRIDRTPARRPESARRRGRRKSAGRNGFDLCAMKLKVSTHSRLQVTPPVRKITSVPQREFRCQRDQPQPLGAVVKCSHAGLMRRMRRVDSSGAIEVSLGVPPNSTPCARNRVARLKVAMLRDLSGHSFQRNEPCETSRSIDEMSLRRIELLLC